MSKLEGRKKPEVRNPKHLSLRPSFVLRASTFVISLRRVSHRHISFFQHYHSCFSLVFAVFFKSTKSEGRFSRRKHGFLGRLFPGSFLGGRKIKGRSSAADPKAECRSSKGERSPKGKCRMPKLEGRKKPEVQNPNRLPLRSSTFDLLSSFELRPSSFLSSLSPAR
jgi:hypothetical protein